MLNYVKKVNMREGGVRESWIDVLKGIGIILVVIGHTSMENPLVKWIYVFHMPLFFCIIRLYVWKRKKTIYICKIYRKKNPIIIIAFYNIPYIIGDLLDHNRISF